MTTLDAVQALATLLSFLGLGFGIGVTVERRRRRRRSSHAALNAARKALDNIQVMSVRVLPFTAQLGSQVTIEFEVHSRISVPFEVWLGADVHFAPDAWFYDAAQDKTVSLDPGRHTYSRYLTLAAPLPAGQWDINAGIWFGPKSEPRRSIQLALEKAPLTVTH